MIHPVQRNSSRQPHFKTVMPVSAIEALRLAEASIQAKNWPQAIAQAQQAIDLQPSAVAYKLLGNARLHQKQWPEAQAAYEQALKLQPDSAEIHANLGTLAAHQQQWSKALQNFRRAIALKPLPQLQQNLEKLWLTIERSNAAVQAFLNQPQQFEAIDHQTLGDRLLKRNQIETAVQCYEAAIAIDPALATAFWNLSLAHKQQGNSEAMLMAYFQALCLQPSWATAEEHCKLGNHFLQQEQWDQAIDCYQRAIDRDPALADAHFGRGMALQKTGKLEEAIESYQQSISLQPNSWQAHHNLGSVLLTQKEYSQAVKAFEQAIALNSDYFWSHQNLGDALMQLAQWDEAVAVYRRAIALDSQFHWSHYNLGEALTKLGQWDGAITEYQQVFNLKPDFPEAAEKLYFVLRRQARGNLVSVVDYYCRVITQNPSNVALLHRAIEAQPYCPELYLGLAQTLSKQEQHDEARVFYEMVLQLQPQLAETAPTLQDWIAQQRQSKDPQPCRSVDLCREKATSASNNEKSQFVGDIAYVAGNWVIGWLSATKLMSEFHQVRLQVDGETVSTSSNNLAKKDLANLVDGRNDRCWFKLQIPDQYLDGRTFTLKVLCPDETVLGTIADYQLELRGHIDIFRENEVAGWILDPQSDHSLELDLYLDDEKTNSFAANLERKDVTERFSCGFSANISQTRFSEQSMYITLKGSRLPILETPKTLLTAVGFINALYKLNDATKNDANGLSEVEKQWVSNQLIPNLIDGFRETLEPSNNSVDLSYDSIRVIHAESTKKEIAFTVDVIIPVYRNFQVTKRCIESALSAKNETPINVIVVNDQSPEPEIDRYLEQLAQYGQIQLIVNQVNKGFVHSVNLGMSVDCNRDIVLLNSDAIVNDYWLDRLKEAAYSQSNIASVTPISNHASIFSYPRIAEEVGHLPHDISLKELNEICHSVNKDELIDVPTMHGFCCFLRRDALSEIGLFDEQKWGKGYGEEVDWAQRARRVGWRHVALPGVFVEHVGSQSFTQNKHKAITAALGKVALEYPEFDAIVHDFIKIDPFAKYRRRIDTARLKRLATSYMLYVVHDFGGGTKRHIDDMSRLLEKENCYVLYLMPEQDGWIKLTSGVGIDVHARYNIKHSSEIKVLIEDLKSIRVFHVHIHSTIGFASDEFIWQLAEQLGTFYDVTIHDYQTICPSLTLTTSQGKYCGEPDAGACDVCVLKQGTYPDPNVKRLYENLKTVAAWRDHFKVKLQNARNIFAPSQDVKDRMYRYFPDIELEVKPHPEEIYNCVLGSHNSTVKNQYYKVAVIGSISDIKGYSVLHRCALYALNFNIPLEFIIFGHTKDDSTLDELRNVTITGKFEGFNELKNLLKENSCDIAAFFSTCPETYSYTLSEALQLGLVPVALNIGAVSERIQDVPGAILIDWQAAPKNILDALIQAAKSSRGSKFLYRFSEHQQYKSILKNYYKLNMHEMM